MSEIGTATDKSDPYPSGEDWCRTRIEVTPRRLSARDPVLPVVLVYGHLNIPRTTWHDGVRQILPDAGSPA